MSEQDPKAEGEQLLSADDAEAILGFDDRATKLVWVPEWKRHVLLRQITGAESMELAGDLTTGMVRIISMSVVDRQGRRVFPDPDRLKGRSAGALQLLQAEALKLNGFTQDPKAALAIAAARKNA